MALLTVAVLLSAAAPALAAWSTPRPIVPGQSFGSFLPTSVSCTSSTFCVAVDSQGLASMWTGGSWTAPVAVDPGTLLTSVSCPSASFCMAVGLGGRTSTLSHRVWSAPVTIAGGQNLFSVSCSSASFCAAAGAESILVFTGQEWRAAGGLPSLEYQAVSCPSASFCTALNQNGEAITFNGRTWRSAGSTGVGGPLISVSCPSASFCAAVGGGGSGALYNGTAWRPTPPFADVDTTIDGLSCASSKFCMAVAYFSNGPGTDFAPGSIWSLRGDGFTPSASDQYPFGGAVSCPSTSFCMAIDGRARYLKWTVGAVTASKRSRSAARSRARAAHRRARARHR